MANYTDSVEQAHYLESAVEPTDTAAAASEETLYFSLFGPIDTVSDRTAQDSYLESMSPHDTMPAAVQLYEECEATSIPDVTSPEISNRTPAAGALITAGTALGFDITDDNGVVSQCLISIRFSESGDEELAYDGAAFTSKYVAASSVEVITDGFRYSLKRAGGWPSSPVVRAFPVDDSGNVVP